MVSTDGTTADPTAPRFESAALITIDVQCDTLDGQPLEIAGTSACLPNIARLCEAFRDGGHPIVHVVRLYKEDGTNAELCRQTLVTGPVPVLRPGTLGRRLASEILPDNAPELDDELLLRGQLQPVGPNEDVMFKPRWARFSARNSTTGCVIGASRHSYSPAATSRTVRVRRSMRPASATTA